MNCNGTRPPRSRSVPEGLIAARATVAHRPVSRTAANFAEYRPRRNACQFVLCLKKEKRSAIDCPMDPSRRDCPPERRSAPPGATSGSLTIIRRARMRLIVLRGSRCVGRLGGVSWNTTSSSKKSRIGFGPVPEQVNPLCRWHGVTCRIPGKAAPCVDRLLHLHRCQAFLR